MKATQDQLIYDVYRHENQILNLTNAIKFDVEFDEHGIIINLYDDFKFGAPPSKQLFFESQCDINEILQRCQDFKMTS